MDMKIENDDVVVQQAPPSPTRASPAQGIDLRTEHLIPLATVPRYAPRKCGKKIHISTAFRWVERGLQGIHLEYLQVGGTRHTSLEALQRFFNRLSERPLSPAVTIKSSATTSIASKHRLDRLLQRAGNTTHTQKQSSNH
jgi:hypothetical protein